VIWNELTSFRIVPCFVNTAFELPGSKKLINYLLHFGDCRIFIYLFSNLRTAPFKAYCAIWVRRSNFRHQASPRVSPRESTQRRKVEMWARNVRELCLNADLHFTFRDLLHAAKLRYGTDGFISPPKEGVLRIFFALKIRRLRSGANPQTWVPKASMLTIRPQKPLRLS
jgi:hypothetical protein